MALVDNESADEEMEVKILKFCFHFKKGRKKYAPSSREKRAYELCLM